MCKNQRTSLPTKTFFSDYICHRLRRNEKTERRETEREREREKKKKEGKREKEGEREGKGGGEDKRVELVWCYTNPSTDIISADAAEWVRAYPLDSERGQDISRGSEHQIWGHVV